MIGFIEKRFAYVLGWQKIWPSCNLALQRSCVAKYLAVDQNIAPTISDVPPHDGNGADLGQQLLTTQHNSFSSVISTNQVNGPHFPMCRSVMSKAVR